MMQSRLWTAVAAHRCAPSPCLRLTLSAAQTDAVFDAMQAELKRSMTLTLNQLDKPYYLSYTVDDEHTWSAAATLGGLISSNTSDFRVPRLRIRVGDYKFDNTNWTGANAAGPRYDLRSFPIEDETRSCSASICGWPPTRLSRALCSRSRANAPRCATSPSARSFPISPPRRRSSRYTIISP